jgi:hypothetical protein
LDHERQMLATIILSRKHGNTRVCVWHVTFSLHISPFRLHDSSGLPSCNSAY